MAAGQFWKAPLLSKDFPFYLWFLQSLSSLPREKDPPPSKVPAIIFQKECVLTKECSFSLYKNERQSLLSPDSIVSIMPLLSVSEFEGAEMERGERKDVVTVSGNTVC